MKQTAFLVLFALPVMAVVVYVGMAARGGPASSANSAYLRSIELSGYVLHVALADTDAARQLGLGGRDGLAGDEGMLFVFPEDGRYAFWMKDMHFSIDILWLSDSGAIVYMAESISPDTYPSNFRPDTPARYVLELPAGWAASHGVRVGDIVRL